MITRLAIATVIAGCATVSMAQEAVVQTTTTNGTEAPVEAIASERFAKSAKVELASVSKPGEKVEWGDMVFVQRSFGSWMLKCETRLSVNKRACVIEQTIVRKGGGVSWSLMQTAEGSPVLGVVVPAKIDRAEGVTLGFGLERRITEQELICSAQACSAIIAFDGPFQSALMSVKAVAFKYSIDNKVLMQNAPMEGFIEAIRAAADDPFGKAAQIAYAKKDQSKNAASNKTGETKSDKLAEPMKARAAKKSQKAKPPAKPKADTSATQKVVSAPQTLPVGAY